MVPTEGVEPTHPHGYQILSLARLPIPPHRPPIKFSPDIVRGSRSVQKRMAFYAENAAIVFVIYQRKQFWKVKINGWIKTPESLASMGEGEKSYRAGK